jgi:hypothetical protein
VASTSYKYGVTPGEGANRDSLQGGKVAQKRRLPSGVAKVRAGNYSADVDTVGMDPEMKATLKEKQASPFAGPMEKIKKMFQKKPKVK